jgi:hypothetical protein
MRRLVYWCCYNRSDSRAYNIRAKTRREANTLRKAYNKYAADYSKPFKVTVEYVDAFDLLCQALGEGGVGESEP